jgi:hypothetical protein
MFRRLFWLAVGLGAGATAVVMASRWLDKQKRKLSPANLGQKAIGSISSLGATLSEALKDFREASAEREGEIRAQLDEGA